MKLSSSRVSKNWQVLIFIMLGLCPRLLVYQQIEGQHSALLEYPYEDEISLLANHISMCRFPSFDEVTIETLLTPCGGQLWRYQREQLHQQDPQVA